VSVPWSGSAETTVHKVAVEYPEPGLVLAAEDPVPSLEHPLPYLKGGSVEPVGCDEVGAGPFIQLSNSVVVVGDEQPRGEVTGRCHMAVPVLHGSSDGVVSVRSDDHPAPLPVRLDRLIR
jgi:hypothetical protein